MPAFTVSVKWGKEKFPEVEIDTAEPVEVFRAQLYALTQVPPDRQTIMAKGKKLEDDFSAWSKILKNKLPVMMLGSADPLYKPPEKKTLFIEDMTEGDQNRALAIPLGLDNMGNTCYMNAVVQCLRSCPDLCKALESFGNGNARPGGDQMGQELTAAMKRTVADLKASSNESITPMLLLMTLRKHYPIFGEADAEGRPMQQDANECWGLFMRAFQSVLNPVASASTAQNNFIDQYFSIEFTSQLKCAEESAKDEPITTTVETELQLSCFLDKEVKYLLSGIKNKLTGEIEKRAETLDRNAVFNKTSTVTRLPAYLAVQMVRFFYKEARTQGASGTNAKILKDVKFPKVLDLNDVCSEDLQERLKPGRNRFELYNHWKSENAGKKKMEDPTAEEDGEPSYLEAFDKTTTGENCSGYYELYGIVTHKGRSSSAGHYVAWARPDPTNDNWYCFNDDEVTEVKEEEVMKLSGGGDWHTSYVLLYGPRRIRPSHAEMDTATVDQKLEEYTKFKSAARAKDEKFAQN